MKLGHIYIHDNDIKKLIKVDTGKLNNESCKIGALL
ncbi:Glucokinase [Borrelia miyamotoi FR64b]|nr:Glucokinase [Borrelia miyamotoi FR64b]